MGTRYVVVMSLALALSWPAAPASAEESGRKKFFVGASLVEAGEWNEALPWLREALDMDPGLCRAHYYVAQCLLEIGDEADLSEARREAWAYEDCASEGERQDVVALKDRVADAEDATEGGRRSSDDERDDDSDEDRVEERYDVDEDIIIADDEDDWGRSDDDDYGRRDDDDHGRDDARGRDDDRGRSDDRRDRRASQSLSAGSDVELSVKTQRRRTAGGVMLLSGGTVGAGGWVYTVYLSRYYQLDSDDPQREWAISMAPLGYALGITGTAVAVTGIILMVLPDRGASQAVFVAPGPVPTVTIRF